MERKVQAMGRLVWHNNPVAADFSKQPVKSNKLSEAAERER